MQSNEDLGVLEDDLGTRWDECEMRLLLIWTMGKMYSDQSTTRNAESKGLQMPSLRRRMRISRKDRSSCNFYDYPAASMHVTAETPKSL